MRFTTAVLALCALVIASSVSAQQSAVPPAQRAIVNITGQLYRAQNNNHYTVFLVTPEGIIMSDPINRDFARYLKAEFATRFKVPVRYVLYTHRDWDHASGGVVFADTAEFVGHRNMLAALAPPAGNPPLTPDAVKMDANRNGLIERSEATGQIAERFGLFDENGSGVLNGAELMRGSVNDVYLPGTTYRDKHTVTLGGKRGLLEGVIEMAIAPETTPTTREDALAEELAQLPEARDRLRAVIEYSCAILARTEPVHAVIRLQEGLAEA